MMDRSKGEKVAEPNSSKLIKIPLLEIKEQKYSKKGENVDLQSNNSGSIIKRKVSDVKEEDIEDKKGKQSSGENKSMVSSSLSEDHMSHMNENQKSDQSSAYGFSICSNSSDCKETTSQKKEQPASQIYMNQSQSSESNSSSSAIQKIKHQIGNMNLSSSSEQFQDDIIPEYDNHNNVLPQLLQTNSNRTMINSGNISFSKASSANNIINNNKFHFNKENYFDILVSQQQQDDNDQQNVQSTIEKYNHFTQSLIPEASRKSQQPQINLHQQDTKLSASSQDLLSIIFCQNSQQLPFSLNIPQSITKFWTKESSISTEKLDTLGGLEKSINEKFINSRKNSSSQNSSDNLTTTQHGSNTEYSNYHTSVSSSSSSNTQQNFNKNKSLTQSQITLVKNMPTLQANVAVQPLTSSNQQNLKQSPTSVWKNDLSDSKQSSQIPQQHRNVYEQIANTNQLGKFNISIALFSHLTLLFKYFIGNNLAQNSSIFSSLNGSLNTLNNNSTISNLITQTSYQLQNNTQGGQPLGNINNQQINISSNTYANNTSSSNNNKKNRICNCKKTKCLKLYCDCFAVGELCGQDCKCVECCNNDATLHLRNQAIESILERNPFAFNVKPDEVKKLKKEQSTSGVQNSASKVVGCNCRKSNCLKKYCLCYQSGLKCSEICKCTECKNLENGLNSSSHSLCSSSVQQNQSSSNGISPLQYQPQQVPQNLYNQYLQKIQFIEERRNGENNTNNNSIQKIIDNLALVAQQNQHQQHNILNGQLQQQFLAQNDDDEEDENQINQNHHQIQNNANQSLSAYNNMVLNAISQFSLNLQDPNSIIGGLNISPTFQNLQQQATRKKLFLNDSGQTTPVSPGGLPLQHQQSHLNLQNINNLFSLIKNISTDQYQ